MSMLCELGDFEFIRVDEERKGRLVEGWEKDD